MTHFADTEEGRKALQTALRPYGYAGEIDGILGAKSALAILAARAAFGLSNETAIDNALLIHLGLRAADPTPKLNLFSLIGLVGPVLTLVTKGTAMTTDQIGGVIRAILTFLAGLAVARGWVDNETALTIVGGIVTVLTAVWSMHTNRAEKIVPK